MADFCKDCAIEMWGCDTGDLKGLISPERFGDKDDPEAAVALCEGCGASYFNPDGERVRPSEDRAALERY